MESVRLSVLLFCLFAVYCIFALCVVVWVVLFVLVSVLLILQFAVCEFVKFVVVENLWLADLS